jgi:serine/threonine-protein kinase RsbT
MQILRADKLPIRNSSDLVAVRQTARSWSAELGFGLVDQTKIVTAASELARNTLDYGNGGEVRFEALTDGLKKGLRLTFEDKGPGIPDIARALTDGFTTGNGMGLGLGGAKRLSHEFEIHSKVGEGTRVSIARWR